MEGNRRDVYIWDRRRQDNLVQGNADEARSIEGHINSRQNDWPHLRLWSEKNSANWAEFATKYYPLQNSNVIRMDSSDY